MWPSTLRTNRSPKANRSVEGRARPGHLHEAADLVGMFEVGEVDTGVVEAGGGIGADGALVAGVGIDPDLGALRHGGAHHVVDELEDEAAAVALADVVRVADGDVERHRA